VDAKWTYITQLPEKFSQPYQTGLASLWRWFLHDHSFLGLGVEVVVGVGVAGTIEGAVAGTYLL
jgi:hypothetical protein